MPKIELRVAHDPICPWCYVARKQAERLHAEFPELELDWLGFELLPEGMSYAPPPPDPSAAKKPAVPGRLELLLLADDIVLPRRTRSISRSGHALQGAELARERGRMEPYLDAIYRAYWDENRDIADLSILREIAAASGLDPDELEEAIRTGRYRDRIVPFDDPAHEAGIWNVPTWEFPDGWVAEQPYRVIRDGVARMLGRNPPGAEHQPRAEQERARATSPNPERPAPGVRSGVSGGGRGLPGA